MPAAPIISGEMLLQCHTLKEEGRSWKYIHDSVGAPGSVERLRRSYGSRISEVLKEAPASRPPATEAATVMIPKSISGSPPKAMPRSHAICLEAPEFPKSLAVEWAIRRLQGRVIGVLSDIHLPYHDETAVQAAVGHLRQRNIDTLLLNGDVVDFYQGSRFVRYPTKASIKRELDIARQFLGWLRSQFPDIEIVWKLGNHEERWATYIAERAPEVFEIVSNAWFEVVGSKEFGVEMLGDATRVMAGKLLILHGHELGRGTATPVNPARTLALRALESGLIGHFHRTSENSMHTISGNSIVTRSTGCLCALHPEYARVNQWDHGFAVVTVDSTGDYSCELKKIVAGKVF